MYAYYSFACHCQVAIRALGFDVHKTEVLRIMKECDRDNTGKISYHDFMEISECVCARVLHVLTSSLSVREGVTERST